MTLNVLANDTLADADAVMENFYNAYPKVVASTPYTGSGFNASQTTAGTSTANTTLTVASSIIYDYIRIVFLIDYTVKRNGSSGNSGLISLKIETSEASAGSWTTRLDKTLANAQDVNNADFNTNGLLCFEFYYAPTSGEKTNGLDIKITGTATCAVSGGTNQATLTNVQTMVYAN